MNYAPSRIAYNAILRKCRNALDKKWAPGELRRFVDVDAFLVEDLEKVFWDLRKAGYELFFMHQADPNEKPADWVKRKKKYFFEFHPPKDKTTPVLSVFVSPEKRS